MHGGEEGGCLQVILGYLRGAGWTLNVKPVLQLLIENLNKMKIIWEVK